MKRTTLYFPLLVCVCGVVWCVFVCAFRKIKICYYKVETRERERKKIICIIDVTYAWIGRSRRNHMWITDYYSG